LKNLQKLKDGTGPNLLTTAQPKLFKLTSWGGVEWILLIRRAVYDAAEWRQGCAPK